MFNTNKNHKWQSVVGCILLMLSLFICVNCSPPPQTKQIETPPNILIILTDDQGYGDVSAINPEAKFKTPNIDRIAKEGIIFTDGHSSDGVCTPSRYSLLTGRYSWRTSARTF